MLTRVIPGGVIEEHDGITAITTGIQIPFFNPAFLSRPPAGLAATFADIGAFYARHNVPWVLRAYGNTARVLAPTLEAALDAREGAMASVLESSEQGFSVYDRIMGATR